jgi:hypothetical protein
MRKYNPYLLFATLALASAGLAVILLTGSGDKK